MLTMLNSAAMHRIHMIEVVGDEANGVLPDQTVLNTVPNAPLSGSTPLARIMGLAPTSSDTNNSGVVQFIAGDHSSFVRQAASAAGISDRAIRQILRRSQCNAKCHD